MPEKTHDEMIAVINAILAEDDDEDDVLPPEDAPVRGAPTEHRLDQEDESDEDDTVEAAEVHVFPGMLMGYVPAHEPREIPADEGFPETAMFEFPNSESDEDNNGDDDPQQPEHFTIGEVMDYIRSMGEYFLRSSERRARELTNQGMSEVHAYPMSAVIQIARTGDLLRTLQGAPERVTDFLEPPNPSNIAEYLREFTHDLQNNSMPITEGEMTILRRIQEMADEDEDD